MWICEHGFDIMKKERRVPYWNERPVDDAYAKNPDHFFQPSQEQVALWVLRGIQLDEQEPFWEDNNKPLTLRSV